MGAVKYRTNNDLPTAEEVEKLCFSYFKYVEQQTTSYADNRGRIIKRVKPMTLNGLAIYLGINYDKLREWENVPDLAPVLAYAREKIEQQIIEYSLTGEFNAIFAKFYLANRFKYQDRVTHDLSEDSKKLIESQQQLNNRIGSVLKFEKKAPEDAEIIE